MAIETKHPEYDAKLPLWVKMDDCYDGEEMVKSKTTTYLSATSGQIADGAGNNNANSKGNLNYNSYITRAAFPDSVFDAVEVLLGIMHRKAPEIKLPAKMKGITTTKGESMPELLRRINEHQLRTGRLGLLADIPNDESNGGLPYIALYQASDIINWDDGSRSAPGVQELNLVVLQETEDVRSEFDWESEEKYRALQLGEFEENEAEGKGTYSVTVHNKTEEAPEKTIFPNYKGKMLDQIPFTFINAKDLVPETDRPPLLGLANLALTIYRGEADHRQALFMQGQDTLVVIGGKETDEFRVGVGATIIPPIGGDAKYIGTNPVGLPEMRKQLENDKKVASHKAAQMTDTTSRQKESGDALRTRVGAQTATINRIALAGAQGLEDELKIIAIWVGANPDEVSVKANMEFADDELTGKTIVEYMTAKQMGAPFSLESIHALLSKKGLTEMEFEAEVALIGTEEPLVEVGTGEGGEGDEGDEGDGDA